MKKKNKLQRLLKILTPDNTLPDLSAFDAHVEELKGKLKDKIIVKTLDEVNLTLEKFKSRVDLQPLQDSLTGIETRFQDYLQTLYSELESATIELDTADETRASGLVSQISDVQNQITDLETSFSSLKSDIKKVKKSIPDLTDIETRLAEFSTELSSRIDTLENEEPQEIQEWTNAIENLRLELLKRINAIGGGSMHQRIQIAGVTMSTKYADINFVSGVTAADNNTTRQVDLTVAGGGSGVSVVTISGTINDSNVTFTAASQPAVLVINGGIYQTTGGAITWTYSSGTITLSSPVGTGGSIFGLASGSGGGGGGVARSVNLISTPTTAGATASTDYVYLVSGTTTLTLPTAVSNTNLYTIKNTGTNIVTVATTSAQTIDGSSSVTLPNKYSSLDLISDGSNWNVV